MAKRKSGYTLLEMSIVVVVIAMVVGGTLVGKSLIDSAEIRRTMQQKQSYDTAVNAFEAKYNCLPSNCKNVVELGLPSWGVGAGDGIIYLYGSWGNMGEINFWRQLKFTGLISDAFVGYTNAQWDGQITVPGFHSPACPICARSEISFGGNKGLSGGFFLSDLEAIPSLNCSDGGAYSPPGKIPTWQAWVLTQTTLVAQSYPTVTGADAFYIDNKADDGKPLTGSVIVVDPHYYSNGLCPGPLGLPNESTGLRYPFGCASGLEYNTNSDAAGCDLIWEANF